MKIAISGLSGVGSSSTAKLVAERLSLPMNNFTFRNLAQERGLTLEDLQVQSKTDTSIDTELDKRLIKFIKSNEKCVIATDLACWLDDPMIYEKLDLTEGAVFDLKIWLEAPLEVRAKRMHEREGGEYEHVRAYNHKRDMDNRERYLKLYGVDIFDHSDIDWKLDTSNLTLEQVVDLICSKLSFILDEVYTE